MKLEGKLFAEKIISDIRERVSRGIRAPKLAIFDCLHTEEQRKFIERKVETGREVGIETLVLRPKSLHEAKRQMQMCNRDPLTDGILVQLPLPSGWDVLLPMIGLSKDVDRLNPQTTQYPTTVEVTRLLLRHVGVPLEGQYVVVAGASRLVGFPHVQYFLSEKASVLCLQSGLEESAIRRAVEPARVVVTGVPVPRFIHTSWLAKGAVAIDVGYVARNGEVHGNLCLDKTDHLAAYTPVPGGVGPMTVARLLEQLVSAWEENTSQRPDYKLA